MSIKTTTGAESPFLKKEEKMNNETKAQTANTFGARAGKNAVEPAQEIAGKHESNAPQRDAESIHPEQDRKEQVGNTVDAIGAADEIPTDHQAQREMTALDLRDKILLLGLMHTEAMKGKARDNALFDYLVGAAQALYATKLTATPTPPWLWVIGIRGGNRVQEAQRMLKE